MLKCIYSLIERIIVSFTWYNEMLWTMDLIHLINTRKMYQFQYFILNK